MLRITAADYNLLIKTRNALRASSESIPEEISEDVSAFCAYVDRLEADKAEDLVKHREALKAWRSTPTGKEKNKIINDRSMKLYLEKKRAEKNKEKKG